MSKLLILPVNDFGKDENVETVNGLIASSSVGGLVLGGGEIAKVEEWIKNHKSIGIKAPLIALRLSDWLNFPLEGYDELPKTHQLELLSDTTVFEDIGYLIGAEIRRIGFDIVFFEGVSEVLSSWQRNYLNGVSQAGVPFAFLEDQNNYLHTTDLGIHIAYPKYEMYEPKECLSELQVGADMVMLPSDLDSAQVVLSKLYDIKPPKKKLLKAKGKRVINSKLLLQKHRDQKTLAREVDLDKLFYESLLGSVVLLKNDNDVLPLQHLDQSHFSTLAGDGASDNRFRAYVDKYIQAAHYNYNYLQKDERQAVDKLKHFDVILAFLSESDLNEKTIDLLKDLEATQDVVIAFAGKRESLKALSRFSSVVWVPEQNMDYAALLPQALFGARDISGINRAKTEQEYLYSKEIGRLKYGFLDTPGVCTDSLTKIDMVVRDAIQMEAFPGCQVLMAKNGTVVYNKSFGYLTYDSIISVENHTIYDIASVTKVAATVPSMMFLRDHGKLSIKDSIGQHLDEFEDSDKSGLLVKDLLTHQSGLRAYLPFWRNAKFDPEGDDFRFKLPRRRRYKSKTLRISWEDSITSWIAASRYHSLKKEEGGYSYLYSDLGFITLKELAEENLNQPMDVFLDQNLFSPMGMNSTGYVPLCQFPIDMIAPTEEDRYLRNNLVWGNVHDRNAALLGGISGHAGLFSTASDLGKYMQMLLRGGFYGGQRYFTKETVDLFTSRPENSERRALGWDRPDEEVNNASQYASDNAFGHSGFTGTIVWADPKYDLVYVFLSNRVYPDAGNTKLIQNNIRTKIHDIMYESFMHNLN
ncbi:MAG: serine hydrolase [Cyclobacteriaceae bacterium]